MAFFSRDKIDDIVNVEELFLALTKRKYWKRIRPEIIRKIVDHAEGDIVKLRRFRYVSEVYYCVENNFIDIAKDDDDETAISLIALTLERLAAQLAQHIGNIPDRSDQQEQTIAFAEMAYTSSILCNPLILGSYAGLAFFYSAIGEAKMATEAFEEYDRAEQRLLQKSDKDLSYYDRALKEQLPEMRQKISEFRDAL